MLNGNNPHYLDKNHPNYERWKRSREISYERGKFVRKILSNYKNLNKVKILDIGSGFGGTIENFIGDDNIIYSVEIDEYKLQNQVEDYSVKKFLCDAYQLPCKEKFDLIILQDFIEHIENPEAYLKYIIQFLKDDGLIYLSTPNRLSLINLFSDPHWGFPVVSVLPRRMIKKIFIPIFRRTEIHRKDIAQLLSLKELSNIFVQLRLKYYLNTTLAVQTLFENPEQIIWSNLHLALLKIIKKLNLQRFFIRIANNENGFVNKFFTPTFYFVLRKLNK
ncbi:MAG: class I SAM-dependent methyltransferase [Ignavibacteria bacterium]